MENNNFFKIIPEAYVSDELYKYEEKDGSIHKKSGLKLIGAFLGWTFKRLTRSSKQAKDEMFRDLFNKCIYACRSSGSENSEKKQVREITSSESEELKEISRLFFMYLSWSYDFQRISKVFENIPQENLYTLSQSIYSLSGYSVPGYSVPGYSVPGSKYEYFLEHDMLGDISKIPNEERADVLKKAAFTLSNEVPNDEKRAVIRTLALIQEKDRTEETINAMISFFHQNTYWPDRICHLLNDVPLKDRAARFIAIGNFISEARPGDKTEIFEKIIKIPSEIMRTILPVLQDVEIFTKIKILETISETMEKISADQRAEPLNLFASLFEDCKPDEIETIHQIIKEIPAFERIDAIQTATPFFTDHVKAQILDIIIKIPQNQRTGLIDMAKPLLELFPHGITQLAMLFPIYRKKCANPTVNIPALIENAVPIFKGIENPFFVIQFLEEILNTPKYLQDLILEKISQLPRSAYDRLNILHALKFITPMQWDNFFKFLSNNPREETHFSTLIKNYFDINSDAIEQNHLYLKEKLEGGVNEPWTGKMAALILSYRKSLFLKEGQDLLKIAAEIHAVFKDTLELY